MDINKPSWIRSSCSRHDIEKMESLMSNLSLNTVCVEANCPNRGECFRNRTATFLILGKNCTRRCRFCNVQHGTIVPPDTDEVKNVLQAAITLNLKHVVITSVTRDDLPDGGATHFANVVNEIKKNAPGVSVELLIPDLQGNMDALKIIMDSNPDILAHNLETVPRLYPEVRPGADYQRSMDILAMAKKLNPNSITKTGIMVGLGETADEVAELLRESVVHCEGITIGQYLRPTPQHLPVVEYIKPEQFASYEKIAYNVGFSHVMSGPMVRSSYHAAEMLESGGKK